VGNGVHYELRLVCESSIRLDAVVGGKCRDTGPVGTRPEFVEDTLRCSCLWLGGEGLESSINSHM